MNIQKSNGFRDWFSIPRFTHKKTEYVLQFLLMDSYYDFIPIFTFLLHVPTTQGYLPL